MKDIVKIFDEIAAPPSDPRKVTYDPTDYGRISKKTATTKDRPILPPPSDGDLRAAAASSSRAPMTALAGVDVWDGLSEEEWTRRSKATEADYLEREQERMNRVFGDLGHEKSFYDMANQRDAVETFKTDVNTSKRVPVITRREELPGDDGVRRSDTAEIVDMDHSPPFGSEVVEPTEKIRVETHGSSVVEAEEVEREVRREPLQRKA